MNIQKIFLENLMIRRIDIEGAIVWLDFGGTRAQQLDLESDWVLKISIATCDSVNLAKSPNISQSHYFLKNIKQKEPHFWCIFRVTAKLRRRYSDFSYTPCPHICIASPIINIPYQGVIFVTIDELSLTHIITQSSQLMLQFTLDVLSLGLDKCIMTCFYHYDIIQNIFTVLKILCASPSHLFPPTPNPWNSLIILLNP